ncbi:PRK06851 family protein [Metallumcola ferriviriculae]|uniref:PRK06851 family protein n=1 Tax=Metallumcola ferriviriculae TaxID=3039180 RepID=A0AAU0USR7_9FIRM|nr:PRK06851 family protein [Desulfitibacteraceae bacterium MK1]
MSEKGSLKKMFPGGNTSIGFYSFYDYIISQETATRIMVIKGGPGVGKSTFMRKISLEFRELGYDVEFHCCSSDNGSIDGLVIDGKVAMIDGTAPHVVDPKNPGAVDEIIHLGDHWQETVIRKFKNEVLAVNKRVGRLFNIAYRSLAEAKVIHDEWESYITESMEFNQVNKLANELLTEIFAQQQADYGYRPKVRKMFGSAITPNGLVNTFDTLLQDICDLYILQGEPGSGKSAVIERVAASANARGLDMELYYCPFDPNKLDCIIIPKLKKAVINGSNPTKFDPGQLPALDTVRFINLDRCSNPEILNLYAAEISQTEVRFDRALNRAISYINKAKAAHDEMEEYYIPAMDFEAIETRRRETVKRIKNYLSE